jgi:hypothetical protein
MERDRVGTRAKGDPIAGEEEILGEDPRRLVEHRVSGAGVRLEEIPLRDATVPVDAPPRSGDDGPWRKIPR